LLSSALILTGAIGYYRSITDVNRYMESESYNIIEDTKSLDQSLSYINGNGSDYEFYNEIYGE
jgi:hypothetical protein